jgi:hypothetical protein
LGLVLVFHEFDFSSKCPHPNLDYTYGTECPLGSHRFGCPWPWVIPCTGFITLSFFIYKWFYDIIIESRFEGYHTKRVVRGLKLGMILFIVSEIMFFFSFF